MKPKMFRAWVKCWFGWRHRGPVVQRDYFLVLVDECQACLRFVEPVRVYKH